MITIAPDLSAPTEAAIDRSRHPDREPLNPTPEPERSVGLDEEMYMIGLDAEMQNPEAHLR